MPSPFAIDTFLSTAFAKLSASGWGRVRSTQTSTAMAEVNAMHGLEGAQSAISVEESSASMFRVFPNPTRAIITVELGSEMSGTYQVYNSIGELLQEGMATTSFQLTIPTSGEYLLRVQSNEGVFYERISVVR
jgi:hypothetical protein